MIERKKMMRWILLSSTWYNIIFTLLICIGLHNTLYKQNDKAWIILLQWIYIERIQVSSSRSDFIEINNHWAFLLEKCLIQRRQVRHWQAFSEERATRQWHVGRESLNSPREATTKVMEVMGPLLLLPINLSNNREKNCKSQRLQSLSKLLPKLLVRCRPNRNAPHRQITR